MALNLEHLQRLTARIAVTAAQDTAALTSSMLTISETYADDVAKAEELKAAGMESVINRVLADLDALSASADELQGILDLI